MLMLQLIAGRVHRELSISFRSFPKTQQHISVLDLVIGLTDGFQFELSKGLECLDATSRYDGGAGSISVR
jgi:hypothetical protein